MHTPSYPPEVLSKVISSVKKYLTPQGPLDSLVHFNTLLGFESCDFDQAVRQLSAMKGCQAYMQHSFYVAAARRGRIDDEALKAVFNKHHTEEFAVLAHYQLEPFALFKALLLNPEFQENSSSIAWQFRTALASRGSPAERDSWLTTLSTALAQPERLQLLRHTELARRALRFCFVSKDLARANQISYDFLAGYFDKGIASWPLDKDQGGLVATFISSVVKVDQQLPRPLRQFSPERVAGLAKIPRDRLLADLLARYKVSEEQLEKLLYALLADVQGWGGLLCFYDRFNQSEHFVELLLMRVLLFYLLELDAHAQRAFVPEEKSIIAYSFSLLQLLLALPLAENEVSALIRDLPLPLLQLFARFDHDEKCRYLQIAFEYSYYADIAGALKAQHQRQSDAKAPSSPPTCIAIFCLDEREESIRRHIEELDPGCATEGFAGFFNIDMRYNKARSAQALNQCPIVVNPQKLVAEEVLSHSSLKTYLDRFISATHRLIYRKKPSLFVGALLHSSVLIFTIFNDIFRFTMPHLFARSDARLQKWRENHQITRLSTMNNNEGFTPEEIAPRLATVFKTLGLADRFTPLVFIFGHGSTSRNNPHSSGYDCGACGAKQGGPNARAFAALANDAKVRQLLRTSYGIDIPAQTWLVGAMHNTCNDTIDYFDVDLIPPALSEEFAKRQRIFFAACTRNASERGRRFLNVPFADIASTYLRVKTRSSKYAQPRPECGHATNAICIVGSRDLSKGIFLDRRAFLCSYHDASDADGSLLAQLLAAAVPVCSGINLEYYFSCIDNEGLGSGSKLSHNITSLVGVVNGSSGDLKTGLPQQMIEIHEPLRLLFIIATSREKLLSLRSRIPHVFTLIANNWIHLALWDQQDGSLRSLDGQEVHTHARRVPRAKNSLLYYHQEREHLEPCLLGDQSL
jgi:uncharacterized protein YbcC (UPF0753/DUF2309 family)